MSEGLFITLEGGEGCGKSTQQQLLASRLRAAGLTVRELREPGATPIAEAVRSLLLDPASEGLDARAELLLYEAARAQLMAEIIAPALEAGEIVICDRHFDSSTAYQGYGRGLPLGEIDALNLVATAGRVPDRTIVLDLDPALGVARATTETTDRLEAEGLAFHERVREGFLAIAASDPDRVRVVDADAPIGVIAARIAAALADIPVLRDALGVGA